MQIIMFVKYNKFYSSLYVKKNINFFLYNFRYYYVTAKFTILIKKYK